MRKPATTFEVYPPEAAPQATRDLAVWQNARLFVLVPDIIPDSDF